VLPSQQVAALCPAFRRVLVQINTVEYVIVVTISRKKMVVNKFALIVKLHRTVDRKFLQFFTGLLLRRFDIVDTIQDVRSTFAMQPKEKLHACQ
jgi:hypothetical protein